MKLGFIGCGNMGQALLKGVLNSGVIQPSDVTIITRSPDSAAKLAGELHVNVADSLEALVQSAEILILATKPADAQNLLTDLAATSINRQEHLLISIAAGVSLETIERLTFRYARNARVMPNTPCMIGMGASGYCLGPSTTQDDAHTIEQIFGTVGYVTQVPEKLMDAVTAISGAGPAYIFLLLEALADSGVALGLPRNIALDLAAHTVSGSATMQIQTGQHPAQLKDMVTSPGGATIRGLAELEKGGMRATIFNAVESARKRSSELDVAPASHP